MVNVSENSDSGDVASERRPLAIVTGAQRGIGEAIARALACGGHDVVLADLHIRNSASQLQQRWGCSSRVFCKVLDVSDEESVRSLFDDIVALGYPVAPDILVNNAAVQTWGPMIDMSLDDWRQTLEVNLTGAFLMTRAFAQRHRACKQTGGVIINLGSGCNRLAFPNLAAYAASKGGVEMFTRSSALELGALGIRVNCVAPGAIETERTQVETQTYAASWSPLTPLQRIGTVNDVANAVVAMVSDNLRFVTGETLNVDGGVFSRAIWPQQY